MMKWSIQVTSTIIIALTAVISFPILATHDNTDVQHQWTTSNITSDRCSPSASWSNYGAVGDPTGTGTKRVAASLHWYEGYNDLDLRLRDPNGNYTTSALPVGYIDEETYPLTWYSGGYVMQVRCSYYDSVRDTDGNVQFHAMVTSWRPRTS
ncbi:MAG: hypothetical protein QW574_05075 [Candidatus Nitrosocaldus sp.]